MSELSRFQTAVEQVDKFGDHDPSLTEKIGLGGILAYLMGKNTLVKNVDTFGFGNVEGSYGTEPKPLQAVSNLTNVGGGNRRNLPFQIARKALGFGMPTELESMEESLRRTEEYMSKLKSAGKPVPGFTTFILLSPCLAASLPYIFSGRSPCLYCFIIAIFTSYGSWFDTLSNLLQTNKIKLLLKNYRMNLQHPLHLFLLDCIDKIQRVVVHAIKHLLHLVHLFLSSLYLSIFYKVAFEQMCLVPLILHT